MTSNTCAFHVNPGKFLNNQIGKTQIMTQHLVLSVLSSYSPQLIVKLSKAVHDCNANIIESRMTSLGTELSILIFLSGSWDTIAKLEGILPKLESDLDVKITRKRTNKSHPNNKGMPYAIEIVCSDRTGVIHDVTRFFIENQINIYDMHTNTYVATQTESTMFSMHMLISIPSDSSISSIRSDFMDFCEQLNFDAIMEPAK